jgi:hypothetical protein
MIVILHCDLSFLEKKEIKNLNNKFFATASTHNDVPVLLAIK